MPKKDATDSGIRLAELMAALSIATDLGMGQPLEYALCGCVFSVLPVPLFRACRRFKSKVNKPNLPGLPGSFYWLPTFYLVYTGFHLIFALKILK